MASRKAQLPGRGKSRLWSGSGLNLLPQRLEHEEGVGHHHQGQMAMQALLAASLKVIEATLALAILIELLDWPTQMRQCYQARQGRLGRQATEKPLKLTFRPWQGAFPKQPAFWFGPTASVAFTVASTTRSFVDAQRHKLLAQGASTPCAPVHRLPGVFWQGVSHLFEVVTRCRTRFFRLASLPFVRFNWWDRRLFHFAEQADAKIRGHCADIRQVALIQSSQKLGLP
jgi:hypothetical protein